jgi:hypothetical protein
VKINLASLSSKLVLIGLAAALIPLCVVGYIGYSKSKSAVMEISMNQAQDVAKDLSRLIYSNLDSEMRKAASIANQRRIIHLAKVVEENGISGSADQIAEVISALRHQFPHMGKAYQGIFITDAKGLIYTGILENGEEYSRIDLSKAPVFSQVKTTKTPLIDELRRSAATGELVTSACAPINKPMLNNETGVERYRFQGTDKIAGFTPVGINGWAIAVTQDESEFLGVTTAIRNAIFLVAAQAIDKVVETITDISDQVNLLALNATIEAARAGEAGKGFAVVANEIKDLAKQTAQATQDIKEKIAAIQETTAITVKDIDEITKIITEVNDVVSGIATAVEEQSAVTSEIATNVSQAAQGIQEVNVNVGQSATVAAEISSDIGAVSTTAGEISFSSEQVHTSAGSLSKLAEELKTMVGQFKI